MGKLKLYQVAVLWHPDYSKEDEKKLDTKIVFAPEFVLAEDEQTLAYQMVRKVPEEYVPTIKQIEILIRPF